MGRVAVEYLLDIGFYFDCSEAGLHFDFMNMILPFALSCFEYRKVG